MSPATSRNDPAIRSVITPEGVDLRLSIGSVGDRASALVIDLLIMAGVLAALSLAAGLSIVAVWVKAGGRGAEVYQVIWLLGAFILRNAYFLIFESGARGATPGKRAMGLRVAARGGGRLGADAVFARNAMREIELFLPLSILFSRAGGADGWTVLFGLAWSGLFLLFPLFNRDRLRVGDLVAGTWVVRAPRAKLPPDLSALPSRPFEAPARLAFSAEQLAAYGVKELYVLEDVLRSRDRRTLAAVAERIRHKIDWAAPPGETDLDFLNAYYAGLRGRLEQRLLFGHRRRDKFDKA